MEEMPSLAMTADELAALHEALAGWGGVFDGSAWALCAAVDWPLAEAVFVIAGPPEVMTASAEHPTGIQVQLAESGGDWAVRVLITLTDDPRAPLTMAPVINPCSDDGRLLLARLAGQRVWSLVFFDQADGTPVGRRYLPAGAEAGAALRQVLAVTDGAHGHAGPLAAARVGAGDRFTGRRAAGLAGARSGRVVPAVVVPGRVGEGLLVPGEAAEEAGVLDRDEPDGQVRAR